MSKKACGRFDKETIFDRKLLFFIPYYVMRLESRMKDINDDPEKLRRFSDEYRDIYDKLVALYKKKEIDERYLGQLTDLRN